METLLCFAGWATFAAGMASLVEALFGHRVACFASVALLVVGGLVYNFCSRGEE